VEQWLELKTFIGIARLKEKCYTAELIYEIYSENKNLVYLRFLKPLLEDKIGGGHIVAGER